MAGVDKERRVRRRGLPLNRAAAVMMLAVAALYLTARASLRIDDGGQTHGSSRARDRDPARQLTIRVNTFRRNDLLKRFVEHFSRCSVVREIQVVWSDQQNEPPAMSMFSLPQRGSGRDHVARIVFERHSTDSLNNRFRPTVPIPTDAVFSVDDDMFLRCEALDFALGVWRSAPHSMVGFVPRLHAWSEAKRGFRYLRWWYVWWCVPLCLAADSPRARARADLLEHRNGAYSMVLSKAALLHRKYLHMYSATGKRRAFWLKIFVSL